jgi:uncharacterized protein YbgA (DUF1722 family)
MSVENAELLAILAYSYANNEQDENVAIHLFPKEETDSQKRTKLVNFVRKHRLGVRAFECMGWYSAVFC